MTNKLTKAQEKKMCKCIECDETFEHGSEHFWSRGKNAKHPHGDRHFDYDCRTKWSCKCNA